MDKKMHILVADDSPADTELIARVLSKFSESNKLQIDYTRDGGEAEDLLRPGGYDIVFLDINMPERTGLEVLRYVKDNNIQTKVVFLTGYPCIDEKFAKALRADEYIEKPIDQKVVEEIINKYRPA